jgi:oligosaccharide repeat unit polymerase
MSAWIYIFVAWVCLYLGAATVLHLGNTSIRSDEPLLDVDIGRLKVAITVLSAIGIIAVVDQAIVLQRYFGNVFTAVLFQPGDVYGGRITNEFVFMPYAGPCLLAGAGLSGIYIAATGKFSVRAVAPLILEVLRNILAMSRGGVVIAGFMFLICFVYTPRKWRFKVAKWQLATGMILASVLLVGQVIFVSATRGLEVDFPGRTDAMDAISEYVPIFPSIYSNFSATPVAFSMYLATPQEARQGFWGMHTFAPIFRILGKLGFGTDVEAREENYYTPVPMNTSTYLRDIDSDFGISGVVLFPYALGLLTAYFFRKIRQKPSVLFILLLADFSLLMASSYAINLMFMGDWYVITIAGAICALAVRKSARAQCGTVPAFPN